MMVGGGETPDAQPAQQLASDPHSKLTLSPSTPRADHKTRLDLMAPPQLKLESTLRMITMDMGTESLTWNEIAPGHYTSEVTFSMEGAWAIQVKGGSYEEQFEITVGQ